MRGVEASSTSLARIARHGLRSGARTGWFLAKIIVPLSAGVAILSWTGALAAIGRVLAPAMRLFGLPGEAAVPLVAGWTAGVYGGIAAATTLPLTYAQLNVLAIMVLTAHNLPIESAIASRSGASGPRVSVVRLAVAVILGALLWQVLRHGSLATRLAPHAVTAGKDPSLSAFALAWLLGNVKLVVKIFAIVVVLTIATDLMRAYGVFDLLARRLRPLMALLGLSERVTFLWLTGTFLGLSYGSGLIIQEARTPGRFRRGDLRDLHVSIGIAHSLLEDTLLFAAVGVNPLFVLLPRPVAAAIAVRAGRGFVTERPAATEIEPSETAGAADPTEVGDAGEATEIGATAHRAMSPGA
jgi:hypothetical protein